MTPECRAPHMLHEGVSSDNSCCSKGSVDQTEDNVAPISLGWGE